MQGRLISKLYFLYRKVIHSIPILLNKPRSRHLRYVSYSIPLTCTLALLLLSFITINPLSSSSEAFAIELKEGNLEVNDKEVDDPSGSFSDTGSEAAPGDQEVDIMPLTVTPSTTLSIASPDLATTVAPGGTGYLSSNVTYSASDIESYTLRVSYAKGYSSLTLDNTSTSLDGAGTAGVAGSNLGDNTWGFAWGNPSDADTTLKYYTVPAYDTTGTTISGGLLAGGNVSEITSTTKKVVFAAKFADNNTNGGHYRTQVLLSFVATPKSIPDVKGFGGITRMQDMTPEVCNNVAAGTTGELYDTRDYNVYTVAKFTNRVDGGANCWMTQNLRIIGRTITSADSDVTQPYVIPSHWTNVPDDGNYTAMYHNAAYFGNPEYGAYYSWFTATAGSSPIVEGSVGTYASSSICPKGWRLPSGSSTSSDYNQLLSGLTLDDITSDPYNFTYAGIVSSTTGKVSLDGAEGYYWANRIARGNDGTNTYLGAGDLSFYKTSNTIYTFGLNKYPRNSHSVRCLAK